MPYFVTFVCKYAKTHHHMRVFYFSAISVQQNVHSELGASGNLARRNRVRPICRQPCRFIHITHSPLQYLSLAIILPK